MMHTEVCLGSTTVRPIRAAEGNNHVDPENGGGQRGAEDAELHFEETSHETEELKRPQVAEVRERPTLAEKGWYRHCVASRGAV